VRSGKWVSKELPFIEAVLKEPPKTDHLHGLIPLFKRIGCQRQTGYFLTNSFNISLSKQFFGQFLLWAILELPLHR